MRPPPLSSPAPVADPLLRLVAEVETGLAQIPLPADPAELYEPVRYALDGRGKRIRAVMALLAAEAFGGAAARAAAMPVALAVEAFHTFTLVHDDIMDAAETRRGRPAVHVAYSEPTAILAGDLLFSLAGQMVRDAELPAEVRLDALDGYHRMVARLCEGQALDLAFESRRDVRVGDYMAMIDGKTGALLQFALDAGALVGGADSRARASLRDAGHALGRAFQIQDDLLDVTAEAEGWGKAVGGDLVAGKRTILLLRALERARDPDAAADDAAFFDGALDGLAPDAVGEARDRMGRLGVLAETARAAEAETDRGVDALSVLPDGPAAEALRRLALSLARRAV